MEVNIRYTQTLFAIPLRSIANNVARRPPPLHSIPLRGTPYNSGYPKFLSTNPSGFATRIFGLSAPRYTPF